MPPWTGLTVRSSAYYWTMRQLVTLGADPASGLPQYRNGDDIKAQGVEVSAAQSWQSGARLRGSLALQRTRDAAGAALPNSPRLLGKLNLSTPLAASGLRLGYELQYASQRLAIDGTALDGYWLSNLNLVADKWARGLDVSLGIYNAFDRRYLHPGSRNNWQNALEQDGRSVRLKLIYKF